MVSLKPQTKENFKHIGNQNKRHIGKAAEH